MGNCGEVERGCYGIEGNSAVELDREKGENDNKIQKKEAEGFDKGTTKRNKGDKIECGTNFIGK